jgi:DNA-binding CsgD family transcriptional regulator
MRSTGTDTSSRLAELAVQCDSPLVAARARHAAAIRAREPLELTATADDFEAIGALLLAAEAAARAADAFRRAGQARAAAAAALRSQALITDCEGAAVTSLSETYSVVPLSRRERQIAMLATEGLASKDIADRLYLSIRTVNNHLHNIYTKLGVTGRADLSRALGSSQRPPNRSA